MQNAKKMELSKMRYQGVLVPVDADLKSCKLRMKKEEIRILEMFLFIRLRPLSDMRY